MMWRILRVIDILKNDGIRELLNSIRRFLYYRMPNWRVTLQLYYLFRGKYLQKTDNGWGLYDFRSGEDFYFPQLQSHALHTKRHKRFLENTYFSGQEVCIEPDDIVFDVGAYIGITSRVAAKRAETVVAIEPSPRAIPSLKKNVEEFDNIEVVNCAISDESSEMDLQLGKDITDDSLIKPDDGGTGETTTVQVKTIEELANEMNISTIDFLKIEAEGLEPEVVRGSIGAPVRKISVAGNDERYGEKTYQEVVEILRDAGFIVNKNSKYLPYNMVYGYRDDT